MSARNPDIREIERSLPMIKVSTLYPGKPGSRFERDYDVKHHMALIQCIEVGLSA